MYIYLYILSISFDTRTNAPTLHFQRGSRVCRLTDTACYTRFSRAVCCDLWHVPSCDASRKCYRRESN